MPEKHFNLIDQAIGIVIVGCATALFATPFVLILSSAFIIAM